MSKSFSLGFSQEAITKQIQTAGESLPHFSYLKGYSLVQKAFLNRNKIPNTIFF